MSADPGVIKAAIRATCPGCSSGCAILPDQPPQRSTTFENAFLNAITLPRTGLFVPQHEHRYPHLTAVVRGAIRVWVQGENRGDHYAPSGVLIPAGVMHTFETLEDDTMLMCIHDVSGGRTADVTAENRSTGAT